MYLQFLGLVISTYFSITAMQLGSNYVFQKIMFIRTNKHINDSYKKWLEEHPNDEWIEVNMNNKSYKQNPKDNSSGKYNVEEKTKSGSDKHIYENPEDSRFNTEKYHKKQHKN